MRLSPDKDEAERIRAACMKRARPRHVGVLVACLLLQAQAPSTDEIIVMTSGTFTAAHLELAPDFERSTKMKVTTAATTMGVGAASIPSRLQRGEPVDVLLQKSIENYVGFLDRLRSRGFEQLFVLSAPATGLTAGLSDSIFPRRQDPVPASGRSLRVPESRLRQKSDGSVL